MGLGDFFSGPDTPDIPPELKKLMEDSAKYVETTQQNAATQFDWAKDFWDETQLSTLTETLGTQLPMMKDFAQQSQADRQRYETKFQPLEDALVAEAESYGSQERQELEAGRAQADVARSFEAQRENALQRLEDYGVDPSQTRNAALDRQVRVAEAASQAGAGNVARERTQQIGRELRGQAIDIGTGTVARSAKEAALASDIGTAATSAANVTGQTGAAMQGTGTDWTQAGTGMMGAANQAAANYWGAETNVNAMEQNSGFGFKDAAGIATTLGAAYLTGGGSLLAQGATGTAVPGKAEGGEIEGPGGPTEDAIPIRASDGEYMMPAHVVKKKGTDFFDKMIQKSLEEDEQQPETKGGIPAYGCGGPVRSYATGGYIQADGRNTNYATGQPVGALPVRTS